MSSFKDRPKKAEFSKKWLISCLVLSAVFTTTSYVLAALDKNPVSELSQTIIEKMWDTSGISFIGYNLQNCVRSYAADKFKFPKEEDYADK